MQPRLRRLERHTAKVSRCPFCNDHGWSTSAIETADGEVLTEAPGCPFCGRMDAHRAIVFYDPSYAPAEEVTS